MDNLFSFTNLPNDSGIYSSRLLATFNFFMEIIPPIQAGNNLILLLNKFKVSKDLRSNTVVGKPVSLLRSIFSNLNSFQFCIASGRFYKLLLERQSSCNFEHWVKLKISEMLLNSKCNILIYFHIFVGIFSARMPSKLLFKFT